MRLREEQTISFQPTKDTWLQQRRDAAVTSYQALTEQLQELKGYEKELLLMGDRSLEVHKRKDWTKKEAVVDGKAFDRLVSKEQERVHEVSLQQEQELGLRLSWKKD